MPKSGISKRPLSWNAVASTQLTATPTNPIRNRRSNDATLSVTVANVSGQTLGGPFRLVIANLSPASKVSIANATGKTAAGEAYFDLAATFAPGAAGLVNVTVTGGGPNIFTYSLRVEQQVTTILPLSVKITRPATLLTVGSTPQTVQGTVSDPAAQVSINGVPVANDHGAFQANVNLDEGHNSIAARALDAEGQDATDIISLSLDMTPPYLTVASPKEGSTVRSNKIAVSGLINDIVRGTVAEGQAHVTVNGIAASIANRSYLAENVPLDEGENTLKIDAADNVGNTSSLSIKITYQPLAGQHIEAVGGQNQTATINAALPEPLKAKLLDGQGQPVANKPVIFRVTEGDGVVGADSQYQGQGTLANTDALGIAVVPFRLGSRAGVGNQRVRATAVGFDGEALFHATATVGTGDKVTVNSGNNQRGAVGQPLPQPFVVTVLDAGGNAVPGAQIEFSVTQGGGKFQNGQASLISTTDSDGRATAELTLGTEQGLDVQPANASLVGTRFYAGFTASALVTGPAGQTRISGVVVDNQDQPLANVTLRVDGTTREAQTDAQGQFTITEAPVGAVRLVADGSTRNDGNEWSTLAFNLVTIAGADNPLPAPVYLVRLDTTTAQQIGDKDVTFTLPEVPGFSLDIKAGSVTFPDGKKVGKLSVTSVNAAKMPMPPPDGKQPHFVVTTQPIGVQFDPPAPISYPNTDGLKPGTEIEIYTYDHDLEEFVSVGLATVSNDGGVIKSNPGVGIIKTGWGFPSPPPPPPTCAGDPGQCKTIQNCVVTNAPNGKSVGTCKYCKDGNVVDVSGATDPGGVDNLDYQMHINEQEPEHWGVTIANSPKTFITAYCAVSVWKARVTEATSQMYESWRLLPSPHAVKELTTEVINSESSCSLLTDMKSNLRDIANQGKDDAKYFYYMVEAVKAHEDVHVAQYKDLMDNAFTEFKSSIGGLTLPLEEAENAADAGNKLREKPEYSGAIQKLFEDHLNASEDSGDHFPETPFIEAEHSIVDPKITEITQRKVLLSCP